jgi:hypothetical protein
MSKVSAFHTKTPEEPQVYHDNNECDEGKKIKPENRVPGTGGRRQCEVCSDLA